MILLCEAVLLKRTELMAMNRKYSRYQKCKIKTERADQTATVKI